MNKQSGGKEIWKKISPAVGLIIGIAILILLIWWTGFSDFKEAIDKGGAALLLLTLFYPVQLISRGYAWKWVYPNHKKMPTGLFMLGFWYFQSINILLPATIGGDIVRGKYMSDKGEEETDIIISILVDKTIHGMATVVMLVIGLLLLLTKPVDRNLLYAVLGLSVGLFIGVYLFIRVQRSPKVSKVLEKLGNDEDKDDFFSNAEEKTEIIQAKLNEIYEQPGVLLYSLGIRVLGDLIMAGEVWAAAWLMNAPISLLDALTLRMVSFGIRSAAFFVWGGLGIQESMYALLSAFVGLSPSFLIVISLATRAQEIITAILGAGVWAGEKGYHTFKGADSQTKEV